MNPIFWKALNLRPDFWIERSLYRSWNIYNISQFNLQSISIEKRSLSPTQVEQIFRHEPIYSATLAKKSKKFWLPSKIMNCCPALDNNLLFDIVSKEWFRCINYLEPGIMAERCFYITRYQEWKWCLLLWSTFFLAIHLELFEFSTLNRMIVSSKRQPFLLIATTSEIQQLLMGSNIFWWVLEE
jgi:hypothetical protein